MGRMFFTYIWRELRRRMRQAILIALGLALGVGLVITVTAASNGVKNSQATVLHTLYRVGTDITVTEPPAKGSGGGTSFGFRQEIKNVRSGRIAAGTSININQLVSTQYGTMSSGSLRQLAKLYGVSVLAAAFGVASVLTMAAVSRRVREFGTLKALGWRSRRVVGQVMGESLVIGVAGAVLGVALGYGGTALAGLAPRLGLMRNGQFEEAS